jgi:hypothetical protein
MGGMVPSELLFVAFGILFLSNVIYTVLIYFYGSLHLPTVIKVMDES